MSDKTWKSAERKIAALLGGERVPVTGRQRGSAPDIQHDVFSIEVKHRAQLPDWLFDAMRQAEASQRGDQIPLAVFHLKGMAYRESLVVLRLEDLLKLLDKTSEE